MKHGKFSTSASGFSLIEVLISVVVLSFGILALTALQSNLIKASTDARAQSVAVALAKDQLEQMRGFRTMAQYLALTDSSAAQSINDTNTGTGRFTGNLGGVTGNLGGTNFTRSWTVRRYAIPVNTTTFQEYTASDTAALPAPNPAAGTGFLLNSEYKTVQVSVSWTDAAGQSRTLRLEDAIAALDPLDSARAQRSVGGRARGPKVIIFDPSLDPGVIPIAVGDGSETAATNPKPVVAGQTTGEDTIETRFDVLTYAGLTGSDKALAQSKVETTVIGCTCTTDSPTATVRYRPTYWDGFRYVPPQPVSGTAPARAATGVSQSRYCNECCRDHHDPAGVTGAKFSPRAIASTSPVAPAHSHYKVVGGALQVAAAGENYIEACRLVRVDGIFDVAADLSNDYMNLLDTGSGTNDNRFGDDPAPNGTATDNYQLFVIDYLKQRFLPGTGTTPPADSSAAPLLHPYNARNVATANAAATVRGVGNPRGSREIAASNDQKWLHARGVYIDFLEPEAIDAVNDARTNCQDSTDANTTLDDIEIQACVLRALPFTTINLTELATWTPLSGSSIKVANANFDDSASSTNPIRGLAQSVGLTTPSPVNAIASASSSNSGIAISPDVNPDDITYAQTGIQPFTLRAGTPTPGASFNFGTSSGYSINNASPRILDFYYPLNLTKQSCGVSGTLNPVVCTTRSGETLPPILLPIRLRVGNYNKQGTVQVNNPCDNGPKVDMPYVIDYDITGFTSTRATTTFTGLQEYMPDKPGAPPIGEYTEVNATGINAGDTITATVSGPSYLCPVDQPGGIGSPTCILSGNKQVPLWNTADMRTCVTNP